MPFSSWQHLKKSAMRFMWIFSDRNAKAVNLWDSVSTFLGIIVCRIYLSRAWCWTLIKSIVPEHIHLHTKQDVWAGPPRLALWDIPLFLQAVVHLVQVLYVMVTFTCSNRILSCLGQYGAIRRHELGEYLYQPGYWIVDLKIRNHERSQGRFASASFKTLDLCLFLVILYTAGKNS